eukprot:COSAG02_NODE_17307_length_1013_cov_0.997812_1_plen_300_part_10
MADDRSRTPPRAQHETHAGAAAGIHDPEPGSPTDIDDEMLRRSRMTRKFTQLREELADDSLQPTFLPGPSESDDSSPQLDEWLRGHVNRPVEPELQECEGQTRQNGGERDDEADEYASDDFEEYDDDESDVEQAMEQRWGEAQRPTLEGAAEILRAAARGEVPAALDEWNGGGIAGAAPVSPDRLDPPPMIPVPQSSPSSSLSSPDHPRGGGADPIAPLLAMLAQIRAVRGQTLAAVERLAPHMPEVVNIAAELEDEAAELQAAFDQLLQPLPGGGLVQPERPGAREQPQQGEEGFAVAT